MDDPQAIRALANPQLSMDDPQVIRALAMAREVGPLPPAPPGFVALVAKMQEEGMSPGRASYEALKELHRQKEHFADYDLPMSPARRETRRQREPAVKTADRIMVGPEGQRIFVHYTPEGDQAFADKYYRSNPKLRHLLDPEALEGEAPELTEEDRMAPVPGRPGWHWDL